MRDTSSFPKEALFDPSIKDQALQTRLAILKDDPTGWDYHENYMTKYDPVTRHVVRKPRDASLDWLK